VSCCCIKIVRDIEAEEKEEEFRVLHQPVNQQPSINNLNNSV
jgi:hypothetical protein